MTIRVAPDADIFGAGLSALPPLDGGAGSLPPSLAVTGGDVLAITATGSADPGGGYGTHGPEGFAFGSNITNATGSAVGDYVSEASFALVGVFLGAGDGTGSIFTIGAGTTVTAPTGATTLYFGMADAFGFNAPSGYYGDDTGSGFSVDVTGTSAGAVPEPATWASMLAGFGLADGMVRRRRTSLA